VFHFFGDSIGAGKKSVPASFYLDGLVEVVNHAVSGADLSAIRMQIEAAGLTSGDTAIINGGVNDLAVGRTPAKVNEGMRGCVAALPDFSNYLVLPVLPYQPLEEQVAQTNVLLANCFADNFDGQVFELLEEPSQLGTLRKLYSVDGLHPSPAGQRVLAKSIHEFFFGSRPEIWTFDTVPPTMLRSTTAPCLGRRWNVWPGPIAETPTYAYTHGYAGAMAVMIPEEEFTVRANILLNRNSTASWFSFITQATENENVQSGFNFTGRNKLRIAHWKTLTHTLDLVPPVVDFDFVLNAASFHDEFLEIELGLTYWQGGIYLSVNEHPVLVAPVPSGLPGDCIGCWMRDCRVTSFEITEPQCEPTP